MAQLMTEMTLDDIKQVHLSGDVERARDLYQALLAQDPKDAESLVGLSICYHQLGQHNDAIRAAQSATAIQPKNPTYYNTLGNLYKQIGQHDKAIEAFQLALRYRSEYPAAYNNLGNCYQAQSLFDEAIQAYEAALVLNPNYADAKYNLALIRVQQGDTANARAQLNRLILDHPKHAPSYAQLAQFALQDKDFESAKLLYHTRLEIEPTHGNTHHDLAVLYMRDNRLDEAKYHFDLAMEHQSDREELYFNTATTYLNMNKHDEALQFYMRQNEIALHEPSLYNIGVIHMGQERHKDALQYFQSALAIHPDNIENHLNVAGLYLKLNNHRAAADHYKKALELDPGNKEICYILSALEQTSNPDAPPSEYVEHLFDQYAGHYDQHLLQYLRYEGHHKLFKLVQDNVALTPSHHTIADLGCGTGLCGALFHPYARHMVGVDLSEKMLAVANTKDIYDELVLADITTYLGQHHRFDMLLAADVFSYIGNLAPVIEAAVHALSPGAILAFTVESIYTGDFQVQTNMRYKHSKAYIERVLASKPLDTLAFENVVLRKQHQNTVEGFNVLVQRSD